MTFFPWLETLADKKGTLLCIGLDPSMQIETGEKTVTVLLDFAERIIEETHKFTLCYKPNIAFYERFGAQGFEALRTTISRIPADIPVILDGKRNDIGNTATAYAEAVFKHLYAHAATLNPYMGKESIDPFLAYRDKGLFILCRTSNPGASKIQCLEVNSEHAMQPVPLYVHVAHEAVGWGRNVGLVVAGNDSEALSRVRRALPGVWMLAPGIGAQGGNIEEAILHGAGKDGKGIIPVVVRHIIEDPAPGERAKYFRDLIRSALKCISVPGFTVDKDKKSRKDLVLKLVERGCLKFGQFTLKSGATSPFYLNLRAIISDPELLVRVAKTYCQLLKGISYDRLSAIPVASVPIVTAVSLLTQTPMLYPRIPAKTHGSGDPIDGQFKSGEKVVLIDDLITTGQSKIEALQVLRREGLVVEDLLVLVERGRQGRIDMSEHGVRLHAAFSMDEIIDILEGEGKVEEEKLKEIREFLKTS